MARTKAVKTTNRVVEGKVYLTPSSESDAAPASAHTGAYGAKPFTRNASLADIMFEEMQREFAGMPIFTREDMLQLRPVQGVSTVTRYSEVCNILWLLIDTGRVNKLNRTDFAIKGNKIKVPKNPLPEIFHDYVRSIVLGDVDGFSIMDIVHIWTKDEKEGRLPKGWPVTTLNCKRVVVRGIIRKLQTAKEIAPINPYEYRVVSAQRRAHA